MSLPQTSPSVGLTHLDRADLTVLDLGLSYLVDALREDPGVLPAPEERVALRDLHRQVLDLKLSTGEVGEERPDPSSCGRPGHPHFKHDCSVTERVRDLYEETT